MTLPAITKSYYWSEGLSKGAIRRRLRTLENPNLPLQKTRRWVVTLTVLCLLLIPVTTYFGYRYIVWFIPISAIGGFLLFFFLTTSVAVIAEIPNDFLDERQVQVRSSAYANSYRWLLRIFLLVLIIGNYFREISNTTTISLAKNLAQNKWTLGVVVSLFVLVSSLPGLIIAWREEDVQNEQTSLPV